ncbi:MAG: hypothetical protein K6U78_03520, partial [Anaerolineae bacterium]|nr:hypothetical protein [Anaerolineae bacterium]
DSSGKKIIMSEEDSTKATVSNITANILYFRIEMNFNTKQAKFFWKDDGRDWQQLGTTITMGFDWQYGTFQGEQYAIMCFNPSSSAGYMDVDWFRLDDQPGPGGTQTPTPTPPPAGPPPPTPPTTPPPPHRGGWGPPPSPRPRRSPSSACSPKFRPATRSA